MAKAVGIGGIFLHFKGKEKEVMNWYESELGFDMTDYGTGFIQGKQLLLLSFKRSDNSNRPFLNIRVDDIETLMTKFKKQKLTIIDDVKEYPYGKFAQIEDPFGNMLELWECYEEAYIEMVEKEITAYKNKKSTQ